nr:hypothetical protein [Parabacteroides goldsteinii]
MKKKIQDALKVKFPGASDTVLAKIADNLAKTVLKDEDLTAGVEGVTFQQVLDLSKEEMVAAYEQQHGLKDGVKVETATKTEQPADDLESRISAAVAAALKPVTEELSDLKGEKIANTRKQQLTATLEKAPARFRERYEKDFTRLTFKDDADYTNWLAEVKADTDKLVEDEAAKGAVFGRPVGGTGSVSKDKPSDAELDAVVRTF